MAGPIRRFDGALHAFLYAKNRPVMPPIIFNTILEYLRGKCSKPKLAVDVGCGSGQSTRPLAPHFEKVIGVDISKAQLAQAQQQPNPSNVEYTLGQAEKIPVEDGSVSLVTCCQATHWLDYTAFCREVDRVLKPAGCVSIFAYGNLLPETWDHDEVKTKKLHDLQETFYNYTMGPYWEESRRHVDNLYQEFTIPYAENKRDDSHQLIHETTLSSYIGHLCSWSAMQTYLEKNPKAPNPLDKYRKSVKDILGSGTTEDEKIILKGPIVLLLGRKPSL